MNHNPWLVLRVVSGSAAAFIALAVLVYWTYFKNRGVVYDTSLNEGLAALQVLFYAAFVVHILGSIATAAGLIVWTRAPRLPTFAAVGLTFGLLTVVVMFVMTGLHICATGVSFPIPGIPTDCGD